MREIKFRAWFRPAKYMFQHEDLHIYNFRLFNEKDSAHILMQYTGLKDKNGKEIYEGDIVEPTPNAEVKYVVRWNEYRCGFWLVHPHHKTHQGYVLELFIEPFERQVIGNIYENPELLENK